MWQHFKVCTKKKAMDNHFLCIFFIPLGNNSQIIDHTRKPSGRDGPIRLSLGSTCFSVGHKDSTCALVVRR